jgi:hypothetical protein
MSRGSGTVENSLSERMPARAGWVLLSRQQRALDAVLVADRIPAARLPRALSG